MDQHLQHLDECAERYESLRISLPAESITDPLNRLCDLNPDFMLEVATVRTWYKRQEHRKPFRMSTKLRKRRSLAVADEREARLLWLARHCRLRLTENPPNGTILESRNICCMRGARLGSPPGGQQRRTWQA